MKKNLMIKVASLMLVLTLASTCMIGTTFAKYVTGDQASDTARVARWGITVSTSGTLFGENYIADGATNENTMTASASDSVDSFNGENIVAPGTKNDVGFQVKLSGTPEVQYTVEATNNSVTAEDIFLAAGTYGVMVPVYGVNDTTDVTNYYTLSGTTYTKATAWAADTDYYALHDSVTIAAKYFPVVWEVVNSGADSTAISKTSDLAAITNDLLAALNDDAVDGVANNALEATYTLTWEWPFSTNATNDGADTILGNLMAADATNKVVKSTGADTFSSALVDGTDYNLQIAFGIAITVTQVD